ncbi:hypothetical protein TELCIR_00895 [Teladorsagia circumcincta]|uniref:Uncharacterized protein n=1 Tax=Teladorsagia circumcincta TaxID=45464 RepID=A0A2G9V3D6_TELCI|nr:hypothetical protein TELCIR_00895 [Teladorsagia circumcincta]
MQSHQDDIEERSEVLPSSSARESLKPSEDPTAQSPTEFANPMQSHGSSQQGSGYGASQPAPKSQFDDEEQQMLSNLPWIKVEFLWFRPTYRFDIFLMQIKVQEPHTEQDD